MRNKRGGKRGTYRGVFEEHAPRRKPLFMRLSEIAKNPKLLKTSQNVLRRIAGRLTAAAAQRNNKATKRAEQLSFIGIKATNTADNRRKKGGVTMNKGG